ncbi:hypothetical protein V8E36_003706 [Tilletia maclaganii]
MTSRQVSGGRHSIQQGPQGCQHHSAYEADVPGLAMIETLPSAYRKEVLNCFELNDAIVVDIGVDCPTIKPTVAPIRWPLSSSLDILAMLPELHGPQPETKNEKEDFRVLKKGVGPAMDWALKSATTARRIGGGNRTIGQPAFSCHQDGSRLSCEPPVIFVCTLYVLFCWPGTGRQVSHALVFARKQERIGISLALAIFSQASSCKPFRMIRHERWMHDSYFKARR